MACSDDRTVTFYQDESFPVFSRCTKGVSLKSSSVAAVGLLLTASTGVVQHQDATRSALHAAITQQSQAPARSAWKVPRTPDGRPDLQGVWISRSATPLERPKQLEGRQFLTPEEVATLKSRAQKIFAGGNSDFGAGDAVFLAALGSVEQFKNPGSTENSVGMIEREFDNRTSLITDPPDGRIPPVTAEARQRQAAAAAARPRFATGPEDFLISYRCITTGMPKLGGLYGSGHFGYYQIVQTPHHVMIEMETIHDARIIPLDGRPHLPSTSRLWHGDSRGRWEGDTLVVDTTNFSPKSNFMGSAENLHLVECFTRVAVDTINYEMTFEDATTWTRPWTAMIPLKQTPDRVFEFACHEGSRLTMQSMLAAARADEKAAEEAAKQKE